MAVIASFPDVRSTGPVHWFVRTPAYNHGSAVAAAIYYLGTCETKAQMKVTKHGLEVFNDLRGRKAPFNVVCSGETAQVAVALNRFSMVAWNAIENAGGRTDTAGKGSLNALSTGALEFGNMTVELWASYSFYNTYNDPQKSTAGALPVGRYFPVCRLEDVDMAKSGTEEKMVVLGFTAHGLWGGAGNNSWKCYSEAVTDFPAEITPANAQ